MKTLLLLLLLLGVCAGGCMQTLPEPESGPVSPDTTPLPSIQAPEVTLSETQGSENETNNTSSTPSDTGTGPAPVITPEPGQILHLNVTPESTRVIDKNVAFRDMVLPMIDLMQNAKAVVLTAGDGGDPGVIENKTKELSGMVRNNAGLQDVPKKMDYVLVNYHEYIDQMMQFTSSYASAADRLKAGDPASARSYIDAGKIASDRADIAVKRINIFFEEHLT